MGDSLESSHQPLYASEGGTLIPEAKDEHFMQRALELARHGIALTSPNPCVGAVIVAPDCTIAGEGSHTYDNKTHAEILALKHAGNHARGATLYLNLEPCSHQGRTGPCADAVIASGIRRVVCSMQDPNPQVAGQGFNKLRAAGIQVQVGLLEAEARKLNEAFANYIRHQTPFVLLKSAMTLDGKIAASPNPAPSNESRGSTRASWITGEAARAHVQQLRHENNAILTGIGTILADDPLLTDRTGQSRRRPLLRVILDSHLRLPLDSQIARTAQGDVLVFCASQDHKRRQQMEQLGIRVENAPQSLGGHLDLTAILRRLAELEITSVMIEGGSHLNTAALDDGIVDKVMLYVAPKIFGQAAIPFTAALKETLALRQTTVHHFGKDFAVEAYLKNPYRE